MFRAGETGGWLLVVADGLGGHAGGALAAEVVVSTAAACWKGRGQDEGLEALLRRLTAECHSAVREAGREDGLDPHSTLAALAIEGGRAVSVHVGDSRIILLSRSGMVERTLDQSVAQLLVLGGEIAGEEVANHPTQNLVYSQIGGSEAPDPRLTEWDLTEGRRFVLCSDGFWEIFSAEEMNEFFREGDPAKEAVRRLESKLESLAGHDNVTAIFAQLEAVGEHVRPILGRVRRLEAWKWLILGGGIAVVLGVVALRFHQTSSLEPGEQAVSEVEAVSDASRGRRANTGATSAALQEEGSEEARGSEVQTGAQEGGPQMQKEEAGETDGMAAEECAEGEPCSERAGKPVPLDPVSLEEAVVIGENESIVDAVEDDLRDRGLLDVEDELVPIDSPRAVEDSEFTRAEQEHKGIPVYAAEVVIRVVGDQVVSVQGDLATDITLEPGLLTNTYPATLDLARGLVGEAIEANDEGARVILAVSGGHRLAWLGRVTIGGGWPELGIFDAATGEVLFRVPTVLDVDGDGCQ